jgi:hypothetical protein
MSVNFLHGADLLKPVAIEMSPIEFNWCRGSFPLFVEGNRDEHTSNDEQMIWYEMYRETENNSHEYSVCRVDRQTGEVKNYDITEVCERLRSDAGKPKHIFFNPPPTIQIDVSPSGKYFIVRLFADASYLYDAETGEIIDLSSRMPKKSRLTYVGFNKDSNLYCGIQGFVPILALLEISSGTILKKYEFSEINILNEPSPYEQWIKEEDNNSIGLVFNYLSPPIESSDGRYLAFGFTVFQFKSLFAILLVYDNQTNRIVEKFIVDTSHWNFLSRQFLFSSDNQHFLFQDGYKSIKSFDLMLRNYSSTFVIPKQNVKNYEAVSNKIDKFFISPTGEVIVLTNFPIAAYMMSGVSGMPDNPIILAYKWDIISGIISEPPWQTDGSYTLHYWISPDEKTVATYGVKYQTNRSDFPALNYTIMDRISCPSSIHFWESQNGKHITSIEGNIVSFSISPDWSTTTVISSESIPEGNEPKLTVGTKTVYDISKLANRDTPSQNENFRKWTTSNNKFSTEAVFVKTQDNSVVLKKRYGKEVTVPIEKLSDTDREYIREQTKEQLTPKPDKPKTDSSP